MFTYYVYICKCFNNSYYTRITNNIAKRLGQHQSGFNRNSYTYSRRPIKLKFYQKFSDVLQAIYFEKKIKGWTRIKKETLIKSDFELLQILSEYRNASHFKYNSN